MSVGSSGNPVRELAAFAREIGAVPLSMRPKWAGDGVFLRLWVPDHAAASRLKQRACQLGFLVPTMMRHVHTIHDETYDGWQMNIRILCDMSEVRMLNAGFGRLGAGDG